MLPEQQQSTATSLNDTEIVFFKILFPKLFTKWHVPRRRRLNLKIKKKNGVELRAIKVFFFFLKTGIYLTIPLF